MTRKSTAVVLGVAALATLWFTRVADQKQVGASQPGPTATAAAGTLVFDLTDDLDPDAVADLGRALGAELVLSAPTSADEGLYRAKVSDMAAVAARAANDPRVELVEPVVRMEMFGFPDDPMWDAQWNMKQIGAPAGWQAGAGRGVVVAVLDTGVSPVEDLEGVDLTDGYSFIPGVDTALDDQGHGTHVAGTIAQATHNGKGVAGVAPRVRIVPYKVLSAQGGGTSDGIAAAIDQAVDDGVDIINMSLGGGPSSVLRKACDAAADAGVLVVAAAGNSGRRGLGSPADAHRVIAVGATGPQGDKAPYSTFGVGVEIAAPGGDTRVEGGGILQDTIGGEDGHAYRAFQGTSMATPHVSGALAVLLSMGLAPDAAVDVLFGTAVDVGGDGFDEVYGHGRIDVAAAVDHVIWTDRLPRFAAGGLLGLALALFIGLGGARVFIVAATGAWVAGGLFFLGWLPLSPDGGLAWMALEPMRWLGAWFGPGWIHNGAVAAGFVPLALVFGLGLQRKWAPWIAGIAIGSAVTLLSGGLDGTLAPFGAGWDGIWLVSHAASCAGAAALVCVALKMDYSV